jgi:hypothetical protein
MECLNEFAMIQHSFDYAFKCPSGERLTLRLYRARYSPAFSDEDYEHIARMLLALHLSMLRKGDLTPDLDPSWQVTVRWVCDFQDPYDMDSLQVTEAMGRGRMESLARQVKDSRLRDWLLQEADLTDVP